VGGRYTAAPEHVRHFDEASVGQLKRTTVPRLQQLSMEIFTYPLQLLYTDKAPTEVYN